MSAVPTVISGELLRDWEVCVIDEPGTVNAFCMPGGKMAVYSGLINQFRRIDPNRYEHHIAIVMGHEIGHAIARHSAERISLQFIALPIHFALGYFGLPVDSDLYRGLTRFIYDLPFSRKHESEADLLALHLLAAAGVNPSLAPHTFELMGVMSPSNQSKANDWISTHPSSITRSTQLKEWLPDILIQYNEQLKPPPPPPPPPLPSPPAQFPTTAAISHVAHMFGFRSRN